MLIHLTNNIRHLIKLSFNTPKPTRGLEALLGLQGWDAACAGGEHNDDQRQLTDKGRGGDFQNGNAFIGVRAMTEQSRPGEPTRARRVAT
jgi:hypothetical protein